MCVSVPQAVSKRLVSRPAAHLLPLAPLQENAEQDDSDHSSLADVPTDLGDGITRFPYIQLGNAYPKASELERLRGFLPDELEGRRLAENYVRSLPLLTSGFTLFPLPPVPPCRPLPPLRPAPPFLVGEGCR